MLVRQVESHMHVVISDCLTKLVRCTVELLSVHLVLQGADTCQQCQGSLCQPDAALKHCLT